MPKTVLRFCVIAAFAFSPSLLASPTTAPVASPAVAATFCTTPTVTPVTPARGLQEPAWLSSDDCWTTFQQCIHACDDHNVNPQNPCWLACDCAYCVCEGILCIQECNNWAS